MTTPTKTYTVIDYQQFIDEHPAGLYELIQGEIVEKVTTQEHAQIVGIISGEIYIYLKLRPEIKAYFGPEARYRAGDDQYNERLPDYAVHITDAPLVTVGAVEEMPTLAVEVKSPTNTYKELREKAQYYLDNGCRMVWLIYPEKRIVEVYQPEGDIQILLDSDMISGADVLPDFELPVATIFAR